MSQPHGSTIQLNTIVTKTRRLPTLGNVLVKRGDTVLPETIVARAIVPDQRLHLVNVSSNLGVYPSDIKKYMLVEVGQAVRKAEVMALRHHLFGLLKAECTSPIDGIIEDISDITGNLFIRGKPIRVEVNAYIPGHIVAVLPQEGVVIKSSAHLIPGAFGIGGETHGDLEVVLDSPNAVLSPNKIHVAHTNKILVTQSSVTLNALHKAVETGVRGIISGSVEQQDLVTFLGYEIGERITGHENVGLTLILTEGFGVIPMNDSIFRLLHSFHGKQACINGSTHLRLRAIRPEIILPLPLSS